MIAFGCGVGNLHQNVDWVTLEPVDERYRPVPVGVPSHTVLITNLANRVQPIIRYDLGDSVAVNPQPCSCGSPLPVIRVEGRSGDILALAAPHGETVRVWPLAMARSRRRSPGAARAAHPGQPRGAAGEGRAGGGADRETVSTHVQRRLEDFLARQGLANVSVSVSHDPPQQERSGKFRQVYRQST